MPVNHAKVSSIEDDPDTDLIRPSDWNADHVIVFDAPIVGGFGDGQNTIPSGSYSVDVIIPADGTITEWFIKADATGSAVFDVIRADSPPAAGSSVVASAPPTLTAATWNSSSTLTGWSTTLTKGDVVTINLTISTAAVKLIVLTLIYERS